MPVAHPEKPKARLDVDILAAHSALFSEDAAGQSGAFRFAQQLKWLHKKNKSQAYWRRAKYSMRSTTSILKALKNITGDDSASVEALSVPIASRTLAKHLSTRWGENFQDPARALAELHALPPIPLTSPVVMEWVRSKARNATASKIEWSKRFGWAIIANTYLVDILEYEDICREEGRRQDADCVHAGIVSLFDERGVESIRKLSSDGSIVFCGAHVSVDPIIEHALREALQDDPLTIVGGRPTATRIDASADPTGAFFRILKHLRQHGKYARIDADGRQGEAVYQIDLFGDNVNIGVGAAHAVFYAKCQNVFYLAKWKNGKIVLEVNTDTQLRKDESIKAWTARWMARYRELLLDLLSGEPENVALKVRVWRNIPQNGKPGK